MTGPLTPERKQEIRERIAVVEKALKESRRQLCASEIQCLEPENSELCNHPICLVFCRWLDNIDAALRNAGGEV